VVKPRRWFDVWGDSWQAGSVHLAERARLGQDVESAVFDPDTRWPAGSELCKLLWRTRTLCGRLRSEFIADAGDLKLLGGRDKRVCRRGGGLLTAG
jgi:hypothetical protein